MNGTGGILVLGHPRSGTTLLRRLLDAHPEIAAPPETHLFGAGARFLAAETTAAGTDMGVLSGLGFVGFAEEEVLGRLRALCFGFLEDYARRAGKGRWAEKTAFDVFHLPAIELLCGDRVHYVGLVRHPLDVAVSCKEFCDAAGIYPSVLHEYLRRYPQPIEAFVRSWIAAAELLMDLGRRRQERTVILRYEDLVDDPAGVMAALLAFLGADVDISFLEAALERQGDLGFSDHKSYAQSRVHRDSLDRWSSLPRPQVDRLSEPLAPLLEAFGYPPIAHGPGQSREEARRRYLLGLQATARRHNT